MQTPFVLSLCLLFLCAAPLAAQNPSLVASPSTLATSGDNVTITWKNIAQPKSSDVILLFYGNNFPHQYAIGYLNVSDASTWQSGAGKLSIPLLNVRSPWQFTYSRYVIDMEKVQDPHYNLAMSNLVNFKYPAEPTGIRLAMSGSDGPDLSVTFTTSSQAAATAGSVVYSLSKTLQPALVANVSLSKSYTQAQLCGAPANESDKGGYRDAGVFATTFLKNLSSATTYYYRVGSAAHGWSSVRQFVTPPKAGANTEAFLFADLGVVPAYRTTIETQSAAPKTIHWVAAQAAAAPATPFLLAHFGDISYARGYTWLWEDYHALTERGVSDRMPYMVSDGNHEVDWPTQRFKPAWSNYGTDSGGECDIPFQSRFVMPGKTKNRYYSYNYGIVHFLTISSEHDFLAGSAQHQFIQADLAALNRTQYPFVVFMLHRPMYSSSGAGPIKDQMQVNIRKVIEPLLVQHKVDLCLAGHVHKYEKVCPVNDFKCAASGGGGGSSFVVHVTVGDAGNDYQNPWQSDDQRKSGGGHRPQPYWSQFRTGNFGFSRLFANRTDLTLTFYGDQEGMVHDSLHIKAKF